MSREFETGPETFVEKIGEQTPKDLNDQGFWAFYSEEDADCLTVANQMGISNITFHPSQVIDKSK